MRILRALDLPDKNWTVQQPGFNRRFHLYTGDGSEGQIDASQITKYQKHGDSESITIGILIGLIIFITSLFYGWGYAMLNYFLVFVILRYLHYRFIQQYKIALFFECGSIESFKIKPSDYKEVMSIIQEFS